MPSALSTESLVPVVVSPQLQYFLCFMVKENWGLEKNYFVEVYPGGEWLSWDINPGLSDSKPTLVWRMHCFSQHFGVRGRWGGSGYSWGMLTVLRLASDNQPLYSPIFYMDIIKKIPGLQDSSEWVMFLVGGSWSHFSAIWAPSFSPKAKSLFHLPAAQPGPHDGGQLW